MHILLVNDDGIGSPGIMALMRAARARGHRVSVCAPESQQSAASHRITLGDPLYARPYDVGDDNVAAFAVSGTPADCVRLALFHLLDAPVDLVISGINDGHNLGMAVHYSGTVGAAMESALNGVAAIATSVYFGAPDEAVEACARFTLRAAERYVSVPMPPVSILNINAPALPPAQWKPPVFCPLAVANYVTRYERRESPRGRVYFWLEDGYHTEPPAPGTDQERVESGHVALTLLGNPRDGGAAFQAPSAALQVLTALRYSDENGSSGE